MIFQWLRNTSTIVTGEYNALTAKGGLWYRAQFLVITILTMSNIKEQVIEIIFIFKAVAWSYTQVHTQVSGRLILKAWDTRPINS